MAEDIKKTENKVYWYLQISQQYFFGLPEIIRLKKQKKDNIIVTYMELLLLSLSTEGVIFFENISEKKEFIKELTYFTGRTPKEINQTLEYLEMYNMMEWREDGVSIYLYAQQLLTAKTTDSTIRSQKSRANKKAVAMQQNCNADAT